MCSTQEKNFEHKKFKTHAKSYGIKNGFIFEWYLEQKREKFHQSALAWQKIEHFYWLVKYDEVHL